MRFLPLALLPLALVACTEQAPVAPVDDGPAFDWMNNPDNGNLTVFRTETHTRTCWTDPGNGLRVCHTTVPSSVDPPTACDIQGEGDPISHQHVGFGGFFHAVSQGETWVVVRDLNTTGDCFGNALVAEGWGNFGSTDNDEWGSGSSSANVWRFRGHGTLTATDGSQVVYSGHVVYQYNAKIGIRVLSAQVGLQ